jgi:hypothetical protein
VGPTSGHPDRFLCTTCPAVTEVSDSLLARGEAENRELRRRADQPRTAGRSRAPKVHGFATEPALGHRHYRAAAPESNPYLWAIKDDAASNRFVSNSIKRA